ncbi:benzoyl-CoA reductase, bzd-type, subunit N [Thermodesulfobacteriota bacterium]
MTLPHTDLFSQFDAWYRDRHEYARHWKERTGGKVMGTFCTYIPEEIIYAANILPVRILGSHEPEDITDPHILNMYCFFCRDCLAQGLKGRYDYLDGIVISQSCMHIRQAFHSWRLHVPVDYTYYINMPHHVQSPRAKPYLAGELREFKSSLEDWVGRPISDGDLDQAVETCNTHRRLMRRVYELRQAERPPLSGLEAMQTVVSGQITDKRDHSRILRQVLEQLPSRETRGDPGVRLMIVGSENDDLEFVSMVESLGATVVIDDHCTGSRYFWNDVIPGDDRLQAIADRYVDRVPCPSKDWPEWRRFDHILSLAGDYNVAGVLLLQQKFCDPHESDMPPLQRCLKENDIPSLFLELAVTMPAGQFETRVEAFLEMLRGEDLF